MRHSLFVAGALVVDDQVLVLDYHDYRQSHNCRITTRLPGGSVGDAADEELALAAKFFEETGIPPEYVEVCDCVYSGCSSSAEEKHQRLFYQMKLGTDPIPFLRKEFTCPKRGVELSPPFFINIADAPGMQIPKHHKTALRAIDIH